jgi:serine beta-lactamase-like protein LACTB
MLRIVALFLLLSFSNCFAQSQPYNHADKVDQTATTEILKQELVGTAVVVIDAGRIVWSKGYGYADREKKIPVDPANTQFRWASISKSITAIAALQLAERGLLDLDADVRTYVSDFPDKGVKITARQLLCHQAGIVHYSNGKVIKTEQTYREQYPFVDVVTALDKFKESPLLSKPGEKYSYTTHGYILLSAVVQRAGRDCFANQVEKRIALPLGMTDFRPDYHFQDIPHRVVGYTRRNMIIAPRPATQDPDVSWKLGGGGYTSPATSLAAFGVGLLQRKLVSEQTEKRMWTPTKPSGEEKERLYGLGFGLGTTPGGVKWVGHSGSQEKTKTFLMLDPVKKRGVAVMTNSEWGEPGKIASAVLDAVK